ADFRRIATVENRAEKRHYVDTDLKPGTTYQHFIRQVGKVTGEGEASPIVRTQPRVVEDAVVSVTSAREVRLTWKAPQSDVAGYHVERAPVEVLSEDEIVRLKTDTPPLQAPSVGAVRAIGPFTRLTKDAL